MKYDVNTIINKYDNEESLDFLFFWGHHGKPDRLTRWSAPQWALPTGYLLHMRGPLRM